MSRRLTIVLDESVTETECIDCAHRDSAMKPDAESGWSDSAWVDRCQIFGALDRVTRRNFVKRHPKCLEAEHAAARMVEIDPKDAAHVRRIGWMLHACECDSCENVRDAITAHARKAGR